MSERVPIIGPEDTPGGGTRSGSGSGSGAPQDEWELVLTFAEYDIYIDPVEEECLVLDNCCLPPGPPPPSGSGSGSGVPSGSGGSGSGSGECGPWDYDYLPSGSGTPSSGALEICSINPDLPSSWFIEEFIGNCLALQGTGLAPPYCDILLGALGVLAACGADISDVEEWRDCVLAQDGGYVVWAALVTRWQFYLQNYEQELLAQCFGVPVNPNGSVRGDGRYVEFEAIGEFVRQYCEVRKPGECILPCPTI